MKEIERVKEIMKEHGINIRNEQLVIDMAIIYVQAQRDLLKERLNENK